MQHGTLIGYRLECIAQAMTILSIKYQSVDLVSNLYALETKEKLDWFKRSSRIEGRNRSLVGLTLTQPPRKVSERQQDSVNACGEHPRT